MRKAMPLDVEPPTEVDLPYVLDFFQCLRRLCRRRRLPAALRSLVLHASHRITPPPHAPLPQTDDPSTVTINAEEDELELQNTCYVKV